MLQIIYINIIVKLERNISKRFIFKRVFFVQIYRFRHVLTIVKEITPTRVRSTILINL